MPRISEHGYILSDKKERNPTGYRSGPVGTGVSEKGSDKLIDQTLPPAARLTGVTGMSAVIARPLRPERSQPVFEPPRGVSRVFSRVARWCRQKTC